MSIITYRDGVMATDSRAYSGNPLPIGSKRKLRQHKFDGTSYVLLGATSRQTRLPDALCRWFQKWGPDAVFGQEAQDDLYAYVHKLCGGTLEYDFLAVLPDGKAIFMTGWGLPILIEHEYYAIGSGCEYAMGALEMGATAADAVLVACKLDVNCAKPVQYAHHSSEVVMGLS